MHDLGINIENFNPVVLYTLKRRFNGESKTPYHCHDFISMIYILSGSCTYNIDGNLYQVAKGDVIICNPGVYHGKTLNAGEEINEFHIGFNSVFIEGLPKNCLISHESCPVTGLPRFEQEFFKCCSDIMLEQEKNEPGSKLMMKTHAMELIVIFLKAACTSAAPYKESDVSFETYDKAVIVNTLISFINENYMKEISLNTISKNVYLSPAYISRVFKEEVGESPINYLIKVRLSKASEMLAEAGMSVKAVAKSVGYADAYYFSKLYKKYYNVSPSRIKKEGKRSGPGLQ